MIRVPFFSAPAPRLEPTELALPLSRETAPVGEGERVQRVESRLNLLEVTLVEHAAELKDQVSERVQRIECRIESALRPFHAGEEGADEGAENVVDFAGSRGPVGGPHHTLLHARNAREAMLELNETLRATREHLESLEKMVERMKRSVASR